MSRAFDLGRDKTARISPVGEITRRPTAVSDPGPEKFGHTKLPKLQKTGRSQTNSIGLKAVRMMPKDDIGPGVDHGLCSLDVFGPRHSVEFTPQ